MTTESSALIYERGQTLGPNPKPFYVYLWSDNGVARYVGKGGGSVGRWTDHLKPRRNDDNQPKSRYFDKHRPEMACFILADGLTEAEAARLEIAQINHHGFAQINDDRSIDDSHGTLLNDRGGSTVSGPRVRHASSSPNIPFEKRLSRQLKKGGPFTPNAMLYRIIAYNPKPARSAGHEYFNHYPPLGTRTTIAQLYAKAMADGFEANDQFGHLAWDYARGFIGVTLPDSEAVTPGHIRPTKELLHRLALEIGTEEGNAIAPAASVRGER